MSAHFQLEEFLHSDTAVHAGLENLPAWENVDNLKRLAETMEQVRTILGGKSITITSGFRSPRVNSAVGGASNSAHLYGLACDFICPSFGSPLDVCKALQPHVTALTIDQLIYEFSDWIHLGLSATPPRGMMLTINSNGTSSGFYG